MRTRKAGAGEHDEQFVAVAEHGRMVGCEHGARDALIVDAGGIDRVDERRGAAVERRDLGPLDRDERVGHARAGERGEQMLDGRNAVLARAQDGRATRVDDGVGARGELDGIVQTEPQSMTGVGR
jgi:hypothetical protein